MGRGVGASNGPRNQLRGALAGQFEHQKNVCNCTYQIKTHESIVVFKKQKNVLLKASQHQK